MAGMLWIPADNNHLLQLVGVCQRYANKLARSSNANIDIQFESKCICHTVGCTSMTCIVMIWPIRGLHSSFQQEVKSLKCVIFRLLNTVPSTAKSRSVFLVHWCLQWNGSTEWWHPLGRKDWGGKWISSDRASQCVWLLQCRLWDGPVSFLFQYYLVWDPPYNTVFLTEGCSRGIVDFTKKKIHLHIQTYYAPMTAILTLWKCWYGICFVN